MVMKLRVINKRFKSALYLFALSSVYWFSYFRGFGTFEAIIFNGLVVTLLVLLVNVFYLFQFAFEFLKNSDVNERKYCLLKLIPPIILVFVLLVIPPYIGPIAKRIGADHRLNRAGGDFIYNKILIESSAIVKETTTPEQILTVSEFHSEALKRITIKKIKIIKPKDAPAYINAETTGPPFSSGWIIFPETVDFKVVKGVRVREKLYRY